MGYFAKLTAQWAVVVAALLSITTAAPSFTPLTPPSYPLAVRTPYLSVWIPGEFAPNLPSSSPQFWFGNDLTWSIIARVDGEAYSLFGVTDDLEGVKPATVTRGSYTSTHSKFTLTAGSRTITLDFFSPISPKNLLRQSLPFAYLTVTVGEGKGKVQIYSDIDSSWTGQPNKADWRSSHNGTTSAFHVNPVGGATFSQNEENQALWGETVYASRPSGKSKLSTQAGPTAAVRSQFVKNGVLKDTVADWSADGAVAFAHDLGEAEGETSVRFAIGHFREKAINYIGGLRTGYYRARYPTAISAVTYFLDDYEDAAQESVKFDRMIQEWGVKSYGANYSDILALSVPQIYGGIEIVVPHDTMDTAEASAFIKEISSNGNINTVDVMYAAFPVFYALTPDYIRLLMKPVLEYMVSDAYPDEFAVHDLGRHYPNATGHDPEGQYMPVEETGNVIIMIYGYQDATGKKDMSTQYADLLKQYADYLQVHGKYPEKQQSLNDALGAMANQTNLAMKAASGLALYSHLTGENDYIEYGKEIAEALYSERLGTDPEGKFFVMQYGSDTWFLVYNHYPDRLFRLNVFPEEVYNITTDFYPTVRKEAGLALNGDLNWGQTNWQGYGAALVDGATREMFISDMHAYISNGRNRAPFSDRYWVADNDEGEAGDYYAFRARPALGSHFALLALYGKNLWTG
ncbi:DUF1793-domain-containing protein [Aspergillus candidus]|uniref:DUF1793-domain-containing protein n=1 Tax=Aspergillus candidus TaxID=41067 RepID=A0A2I2FLR8_ASPCN|nr:DUF1793-domain-containing protein [Aspergillus candidus]PLB41571.1 DUF1793-domain-containing protein [Aspergillus candidus]